MVVLLRDDPSHFAYGCILWIALTNISMFWVTLILLTSLLIFILPLIRLIHQSTRFSIQYSSFGVSLKRTPSLKRQKHFQSPITKKKKAVENTNETERNVKSTHNT